MRRLEPDPEEKKRFEEWDKETEARRHENRQKYYEEAIARIKEGKPNQADIAQWQNYVFNNRLSLEQKVTEINNLINRKTAGIIELTQRLNALNYRYRQTGEANIVSEITTTSEWLRSLKESVEIYRAELAPVLRKLNNTYPNILVYFEKIKKQEASLGQKYFSVIGRAL